MKWLLGFALIVAAVVVGWRLLYPAYTYHYRLTIEVETPDGIKSASSVIEVTQRKQTPAPLPVPPYVARVKGEAVFVDLGQGRNVIALLAGGPTGGNSDGPHHVIYSVSPVRDADNYWRLPSLEGKWDLPLDAMPTLVTFTDLADPASARVIYAGGMRGLGAQSPHTGRFPAYEPAVLVDAFTETFGPGTAFKRATLEMVSKDTPVTRGIEGKIPGLQDVNAWNARARVRTSPSDPYGGGSVALIRNF